MAHKSVHWDDLGGIIDRIRADDPGVIAHPRYEGTDGEPCIAIITDQPLIVGYAIAANYGTNVEAGGWDSVVAAFGERMALAAQIDPPRGDEAYIVSFPGYQVEE